MNEEAPKTRGWPKGKPRGKKTVEAVKAAADRAEERATSYPKLKMKARPNWDNDEYVGTGVDEVDRLLVPRHIVDSLHRDGYVLQWCTKSVRGQETPQELSKMTRGGWTPLHQSDFDGVLDGIFMPKGVDEHIIVEDAILCVRPVEIHARAKMAQSRDASRPVQVTEAQFKTGIPNVTGANHPTATRGNMVNKSVERIEIPNE